MFFFNGTLDVKYLALPWYFVNIRVSSIISTSAVLNIVGQRFFYDFVYIFKLSKVKVVFIITQLCLSYLLKMKYWQHRGCTIHPFRGTHGVTDTINYHHSKIDVSFLFVIFAHYCLFSESLLITNNVKNGIDIDNIDSKNGDKY